MMRRVAGIYRCPPPVTCRSIPVVKLPASEHSSNAAPASSSGAAARCIGLAQKLNLAPGTLVVATPSVARGGNQPGRNVVDRDARTGELSRQVQRKVVLRAFQCSIYSERRLGPRLIDAADRQDAAPAPTLHARYRRLQELDGRVEVDSGLAVPFFRAHIDECGALLYRRA